MKALSDLDKYVASYESFEFSDSQVAERFANDALIGSYCWTKEFGWLEWDGRRWKEVANPVMLGVVRRWVKGEYVRSAEMLSEASRGGQQSGGWPAEVYSR